MTTWFWPWSGLSLYSCHSWLSFIVQNRHDVNDHPARNGERWSQPCRLWILAGVQTLLPPPSDIINYTAPCAHSEHGASGSNQERQRHCGAWFSFVITSNGQYWNWQCTETPRQVLLPTVLVPVLVFAFLPSFSASTTNIEINSISPVLWLSHHYFGLLPYHGLDHLYKILTPSYSYYNVPYGTTYTVSVSLVYSLITNVSYI